MASAPALYGIPLPWIAVEAGWFVANMAANRGLSVKCCRQLWRTRTDRRRSHLLNGADLRPVYPVLVAELFLMFKFARLGPSSLKPVAITLSSLPRLLSRHAKTESSNDRL